ncbi:MAG: hypothetical protein II753_06805, partial [Spirochaetales bacterium]|nr:hypothetical protein [Spirochaetales bacterium]
SSTVEFLGIKARFTPNDPKQTINASEVILGIRPEFFTIKDGGKIKATAYGLLTACEQVRGGLCRKPDDELHRRQGHGSLYTGVPGH